MLGLRGTILVLGLLVGTIAIPVAPAQAATAEAAYASSAFRATNDQRTQHDRRSLDRSRCLQEFAVRQARRMANRESMYHQSLDPILGRCHLSHVGENVAYGFPTGESVVKDGWMRSPDHRANILNPRYRLMGLAARKGNDNLWYVSQVFGNK